MEPIEYAKWSGRFRVIIEALRERPGDVSNELADKAAAEYDQTTARARMYSPLGDQRERATTCVDCHGETWTVDRVCRRCAVARAGQAS